MLLFSYGAQGNENDVVSLLNLPLDELVNVQIRTSTLTGSTQANSPSWVTTINERDWRNNGSRYLLDAIKFQPAVQVLPFVAGGDAIAIRGYSNAASFRGLAVFLDGIPLMDFAYSAPILYLPEIPLFTLTSLELSEGAGSALHGSDSFHGTLGLNSYSPENPQTPKSVGSASAPSGTQYRAALTGASNGYYQAGIRGRTTVNSRWSASLSAAGTGQANQELEYRTRDSLDGRPLDIRLSNRYDSHALVTHLKGEIDASRELELSLYHFDYEARGQPGVGTRLASTNDRGEQTTQLNVAQLRIQQRYSDQGNIQLSGYYWQSDNAVYLNLDLNKRAQQAIQLTQFDQHRAGIRLQLQDTLAALNTQWATELAHDELQIDDSANQLHLHDGRLLADLPSTLTGRKRTIDSLTFEADSMINDSGWHLLWGARMDDYSDVGSQFSPRATLLYHLDAINTLKLIYSEAFRAPTASERYGSAISTLSNRNLKPETIRNHELLWLHQSAHQFSQISLFHTRWDDGIVASRSPNETIAQTRNIAKSRAAGVTLQQQWQFEPWRFGVDASWAKSRNQTLHMDYDAFPDWMINARLGYHAAALDSSFFLIHRTEINRLDTLNSGSVTGAILAPLPTYHRLDFNWIWAPERQLEVHGEIRNVFNRNNRIPSLSSPGGLPDEKRSIALGVDYFF
ncbi:Predicted TonB-dependent receptor [gamma proteobacterium HdN1]|nr:Predicted TonB-dependent receptor [gamma proteobacterium HdN1]